MNYSMLTFPLGSTNCLNSVYVKYVSPSHSLSYSVVVEKVDQPGRGGALRPFSWRSLAALSRITGNVSKLILCYLIYPFHLTDTDDIVVHINKMSKYTEWTKH
ncbi:unnamed protein product [Oncorhynchus mykiss]|uniref:Uncharacterized protein n=1 Tax=Oncorhynchus mykiss TaxID=8022 RepID=A0A060XTX5_ONCMY|nr:unnamed protein product [Oncorhynchus mykiss]